MALVKCKLCSEKNEKDEMVREKVGFYHPDCHLKFLSDKEFKRKEFEKKLAMSHVIAKVYGLENIQLIPPQIYPLIEDIRNDSQLFGRLGKNYKNGIKYEGIAYTYEFVQEKIREADTKKAFKNQMQRFKYGLTIVRNSLADAKAHAELQRRSKDDAEIGKRKIEEELEYETEEVLFKSKKSKIDISDYL